MSTSSANRWTGHWPRFRNARSSNCIGWRAPHGAIYSVTAPGAWHSSTSSAMKPTTPSEEGVVDLQIAGHAVASPPPSWRVCSLITARCAWPCSTVVRAHAPANSTKSPAPRPPGSPWPARRAGHAVRHHRPGRHPVERNVLRGVAEGLPVDGPWRKRVRPSVLALTTVWSGARPHSSCAPPMGRSLTSIRLRWRRQLPQQVQGHCCQNGRARQGIAPARGEKGSGAPMATWLNRLLSLALSSRLGSITVPVEEPSPKKKRIERRYAAGTLLILPLAVLAIAAGFVAWRYLPFGGVSVTPMVAPTGRS